ncbi:ribonuclease H-like domain-containing protein [Microdochium trichocladiopsis]|uniref:Ribonuclease H-like domain-containing protein n=1 Tax=Microdochium trichocladiopsis TaxID=1682393 RepID=A0A9P8XR18_9PEZI|nr:ribonuclease H-like domain-containing protein [Microdochium trichocladiopsis]KAH7012525.1 ribonuclease H-like domain-containing protein [Microdochium trichocladiopsis]
MSIIKSALSQIAHGHPLVTEFKNQVITLKPLPLPSNNIVLVDYTLEGHDDQYEVKFNGPLDVDLSALFRYLTTMNDPTGSKSFPKYEDVIDALNVIMGHSPRGNSEIASIGRSRFFPIDEPTLRTERQGLGWNEAIRGYFQSARPATGRLLLNANVSHGVFRPAGPAINLFTQAALYNMHTLHKNMSELRARVTYLGDKGETKRVLVKIIQGLASPYTAKGKVAKPPKVKRLGATATEVEFYLTGPTGSTGLAPNRYYTVAEYFQRRYGKSVNPNLPVINIGTSQRPVYMPAEAVEIIPGQPLQRKLNARETPTLITFACRSPVANATSITTFGRKCLQLDNNEKLSEFGVEIEKDLLTINERELKNPDIQYKNQKEANPSEGSWNMIGVKVLKPGAKIDRWTFVHVDPEPRDKDTVTRIMNGEFTKVLTDMGIPIAETPMHPQGLVVNTRAAHPVDAVRHAFTEIRRASGGKGAQFVFVILAQNDPDVYAAVKSLGDTEFGIHTTCMVRKNFTKGRPMDQYFANVGLKINLKMGGNNHQLKNDIAIIREGKTMVVGYDVTHPPPGSNSPSLVGLVASVDKELSQWPAAAWAQDGRVEMLGEKLRENFGERLVLWQKNNQQRLPENIIIFRDGVSEGQFQQVLDKELPLIREACAKKYPANSAQPKITVVVSVKRHQTRFYPTDPKHMTKSRNVATGTVVDRGVTQARIWDFFLVAHAALQGTARPAHYTVLLDEVFRANLGQGAAAANGIQELTHEMCYMFGRATKAVSICPPAYYADIVCTRQRAYMTDLFSDTSDTASVGGASSTSRAGYGKDISVEVHRDLRNSMYYI